MKIVKKNFSITCENNTNKNKSQIILKRKFIFQTKIKEILIKYFNNSLLSFFVKFFLIKYLNFSVFHSLSIYSLVTSVLM
jgi:hypothetical protein